MFITEEQFQSRLNSPRNLANRFRNGRAITMEQAIIEGELENATSGLSEVSNSENETSAKGASSQDLHQESIQFREIKRPGNNRPWLSQSERTRIFTEATTTALDKYEDGQKVTQTEIARRNGVAVSTVSDIVNNVRRAPDTPRAIKQIQIDQTLDDVREKAVDRLMSGLGQLTDDKISQHNAKDISTVCANMAKVIKQTIPEESGPQQINLIVYTPELRKEQSFDVIEVE